MEPTAQSLARTYSDRVYPDPWEKVRDFRRVQAYAADHPNAGRVRVGNALELPSSRVRGWLNGGQPDPVRGIQTAIDYGWLDPDPPDPIAARLVVLLAHILAGGSITTPFVPAVTPAQRVSLEEIRTAFSEVGVDSTTRHTGSDRRATEVVPTADGSVLGRCLVTMGAPQGEKTSLSTLPPAVWAVPKSVQRSFVNIYISHRGYNYNTKATTQFRENRTEAYQRELFELIEHVTAASVTYSDGRITVSAAAARELGL